MVCELCVRSWAILQQTVKGESHVTANFHLSRLP